LIIDTDNNVKNHKTPRICLAINYEDTPKRIATNDKNDIRYIGKNQGYVGNVYLPDKYK
jgi:hypothetical protein